MKEIRVLKDNDLAKFIRDKREELRMFRFGSAGSKTRNVKLARQLRTSIAQAMTEVSTRKKV